MSSKKNTQLLVSGLIAVATIGLLVYFSSVAETAKSKKDEDPGSGAKPVEAKKPTPSSSSTSKNEVKRTVSPDDTPKKSNVTDQKELHSKIEELDKKGKAFFKKKKVSYCNESECCWCKLCREVGRTMLLKVAFLVFQNGIHFEIFLYASTCRICNSVLTN